MFGEKQFRQTGYPTPTAIPDETSCLTLDIPANEEWWGIVVGVLSCLMRESEWQQFEGGLDREVVVARWQTMFQDAMEIAATTNTCGVTPISEAPYWDDADGADADDQEPYDSQPWYDDVGDVIVTAFLATIITPAAAIQYVTTIRKLRIGYRKGGVGGIFKIFLDGDEVATVDTYSATDELGFIDVLIAA